MDGFTLGVASTVSCNIFLLRTVVDKEIEVFFCVKLQKAFMDFLIYEDDETSHLLVLVRTSSAAVVGDCIEVYSLSKSENKIYKSHQIYMHRYYQWLMYGPGTACDILASPYLSNQLHLFKIEVFSDFLVPRLEFFVKIKYIFLPGEL